MYDIEIHNVDSLFQSYKILFKPYEHMSLFTNYFHMK